MTFYLVLVLASAISMLVIPIMRRFAPALGLLDRPDDSRKVHKAPVPRVGGWGIVLGLLLPTLLLLEWSPLLEAWLAGVAILFVSGVVDDIFELGHYAKFLAQIAAATIVVLHGHLWVWHMPLMGLEPWSPVFGLPFTVFAIVGVVNAINHSDGLDGLAGGEALLSLIVVLFLGTAYGGDPFLALLAAAAIGGVLGFLRYNTHPATVFMGDAGSQVLGFTLAVLVIALTQRVSPVLSPAVVLFLLGLPVIDILAVLFLRIRNGMNWFKASRNHIHHRLLDLGLDHYEVVVVIYGLQASIVSAAILLRFEADWLVLTAYLLVCTFIFGTITCLERNGWRAHRGGRESLVQRFVRQCRSNSLLSSLPAYLLMAMVSIYLLVAALTCGKVPTDFGWMSLGLLLVLATDLFLVRREGHPYAMNVIYLVSIFVVYLSSESSGALVVSGSLELAFFVLLAALIALTLKLDARIRFATTPLDYLVVLALVTVILIGAYYRQILPLSLLVVKGVVLLYGVEVVRQHSGAIQRPLFAGGALALATLTLRGLL